MADPFLLNAFRFDVRLLRSPDIVAGRQQMPGQREGYEAPTGTQLVTGALQGAFQDCQGLEVEMDVQEYLEGGRNNGVVRRVGRAKYVPLVLKRGMFHGADASARADATLWQWMQRVLDGDRSAAWRYDGIVQVMSADGQVRATWMFERALPTKIKGPELNARTGEIAIEELTLHHEGLRLLPPPGAAA